MAVVAERRPRRSRPRRRPRHLVVALGVIAALVGCGGDDGDGERGGRQRGDATETSVAPPPPTTLASARLVDAACAEPTGLAPRPAVTTTSDELTEVSGIAVPPGATEAWVHNDSGDRPQVFAIGPDGGVTAHDVPGAEAVDWEDIAAGPDGHLYIADIGDNQRARPSVAIYRVTPPDPSSTVPAVDVARLTLTYPDGAHDAEALLVDPIGDQLVVVAKGSGPADVFATPLAFDDGDEVALERIASVATGSDDVAGQVTGGDISPDGGAVVLRTYAGALVFRRALDRPLAEAFDGEPCQLLTGDELQGEAIGFDGTDGGYRTVGEGLRPVVSSFSTAG